MLFNYQQSNYHGMCDKGKYTLSTLMIALAVIQTENWVCSLFAANQCLFLW